MWTELTKVPSGELEPETGSNQKFSSKPKTRQHCFDCDVHCLLYFTVSILYCATTIQHNQMQTLCPSLCHSRAIQQSISQLLPITGKFYAQTVQNIEEQFFIWSSQQTNQLKSFNCQVLAWIHKDSHYEVYNLCKKGFLLHPKALGGSDGFQKLDQRCPASW